MLSRGKRVAGLVVLLWLQGVASAGISFQPLGGFEITGTRYEGYYKTEAYALSGDGSTVVGEGQLFRVRQDSVFSSPDATRGFVWTSSLGLIDLGPGSVQGVNQDGSVLAGRSIPPDSPSGSGHLAESVPTLWRDQLPEYLIAFSQGLVYGGFAGLSADGSRAVGLSTAQGLTPLRWSDSQGLGLQPWPVGGQGRAPTDVADDGAFVSERFDPTRSNPYEQLWTEDEGWRLILGSGAFIEVAAISDDGHVVVGRSQDFRAYRWTEAEGGMLLEHPAGFPRQSRTLGVNHDGSVIVGAAGPADGFREIPFIWTEKQGIRSLVDILAIEGGVDLSGWVTLEAIDVSDDGRTILGRGFGPNGTESWVAVIPEPVSGVVLLLGSLWVVGTRRI
ncbi:MAG: hypothetical protein RLN76_12805 [Phycisphaeraceae bacterium]